MKVLLLLSLLLPPALSSSPSSSLRASEGPPSFFLQHPEDHLCLSSSSSSSSSSAASFSRCDLAALWYVTGGAGSYRVHSRPRDVVYEEGDDQCLQRARCHVDHAPARVGSCDHCGAKKWNIVGDSDTGHVLTHDRNKYCLHREDNDTSIKVIPCDEGYTFLKLRFVPSAELKWLGGDESRLISACIDNDLKTAKSLLAREEVDVNVVDTRDNLFPLLGAASQGNVEMVKLLLAQESIDIDQVVTTSSSEGFVGNGMSALMEASMRGKEAVVSLLLRHGAAVDLHAANEYGGPTALWLASSQGEATVVRALLHEREDGADANLPRRADGITPLMAAAAGGHSEVVRLLLEAGADVNSRDDEGVTALLNVAESGDVATANLLLGAGAEVNYMSNNNFSPLIVACAHGHFDVISALIDSGAEVNMPHPDGVTPLMYAAANGKRADAVGLLLAQGADVDRKHAQGGTALIESCTSGNLHIVEVLLAFGADAQVTDGDGVTPLMSAAASGHVDVMRALLSRNVDVNAVANSGGTALMYAAGQGQLEACKLLLNEGEADAWVIAVATAAHKAQVNEAVAAGEPDVEPHVDGVNALLIAIDGGYEDIVRLLLGISDIETGEEEASLLSSAARAGMSVVDELGASALITAIRGNHSAIACSLLRLGADATETFLNEKGEEQHLLMNAVLHSNTSLALTLIEKGANCSFVDRNSSTSMLLQASSMGQTEVVGSLIQCLQAADSDGSAILAAMSLGNEENITPLMSAVAEGHESTVKILLDVADSIRRRREDVDLINQIDTDGTSTLMAASAAGDPRVVKELLKRGASVNTANVDGHTALMFAYNGKSQEEALLKNYLQYMAEETDGSDGGDDKSQAGKDNIESLIGEAIRNHKELINILLEHGADPNAQDEAGRIAVDFDIGSARQDSHLQSTSSHEEEL